MTRRKDVNPSAPASDVSPGANLWTADDVARFVSRSKKWVYRMALQRRIPHIALSAGTIRFDPDDVRRWVDSLKEEADG